MYYITWVFQFLTLLLGNMGFILLGGKALKACGAKLRLIKPFLCNLFSVHFDCKFHIFTWISITSFEKNWQEINSEFSETPLRLQYYIGMTGAAYFVFACLIPTMSAMRSWLGVSTVLAFTYIGLLLMVVIKDGSNVSLSDLLFPHHVARMDFMQLPQ